LRKLSVLIADDEVVMCEALRAILEQFSFLDIIGECHDGDEALAAVEKSKPDLVFLDIRMPGLTGLEVAQKIARQEEILTAVIFVTAYDDFALKAFGVNAVDYILKPFDESDISRVMKKIRRLFTLRDSQRLEKKAPALSDAMPQKFCAYHGDLMEIVDANRIMLFFAENGEVYILTDDGAKYSLRRTLQEIESKVATENFFRCHRNYIVNMNFVKQMSPWFNRGFLLSLKGETKIEVPVSRANTHKLKKYIHF
jgi:DNA-binding LytR/AlgR family response regulator